MSPVMTFRIAFKALGRNKMRTGLTMLGMIIGVCRRHHARRHGQRYQSINEDQIKGAGTNMVTVNAGNFSTAGVRGGVGTSSTLTEEDARGGPARDPGAQYVAAGQQTQAQVIPLETRTGSPAFRERTSISR